MVKASERARVWWSAAAAVAAAGALPSRAAAQGRFSERLAFHVEVGASAMVSDYQRNVDPERYDGNIKGYRLGGFEGSLRVALRLFEPLSIQASVANWVFPSSTGETGWVFAPMGGLRVEPRVGTAGRFWVEGNAGGAFTGLARRFAFDVGLGFEFALTRAVGLGPAFRYGQIVVPDTLPDGTAERYGDDARYIAGGVALTIRPPPAAPPDVEPPPPDAPRGPADHDGDAVLDPDDHCPTVPAGTRPDPARPGCPQQDADRDGVFDAVDRCPAEPAGLAPDPDRPGCPDLDADRDGLPDHQDHCPAEPRGPRPDPARPGCPAPDADGDGLPDTNDRCPDRPETFNNHEDGDGCPDRPPLVTLGEGVIRILGTINFATGSDRIIGARSYDICDSLVAILAAHAEVARVEVQGHTDDRGSNAYNLELSQRRADAIRQYLVDHGIDPRRVVARGYGLTRPRVANSNADHRAQNRRVEIHILDAEAAPPPAP
ncbi:MAG: OmpA family protein [Polyangiales bacterium]